MNRKQKKELVEVLSHDCKLTYTYKKGRNTCAIGALIMVATTSRSSARKAMARIEGIRIDADVEDVNRVREAISDHFGINKEQMLKIQRANDSVDSVEYGSAEAAVKDRRAEVLAVVRKFRVSAK